MLSDSREVQAGLTDTMRPLDCERSGRSRQCNSKYACPVPAGFVPVLTRSLARSLAPLPLLDFAVKLTCQCGNNFFGLTQPWYEWGCGF